MTRKATSSKRNTARIEGSEAVASAKENTRVARDRNATLARKNHESPTTASDTESDAASSPRSSPVTARFPPKDNGVMARQDIAHDEEEIDVDVSLDAMEDYLKNKYELDKKIKKDDRMKMIVRLRTVSYVKQQLIYDLRRERTILEKNRDQAEEENKILSEKLRAKSAAHDELHKKLQQKLSLQTGRRKKISGDSENKELVAVIETQCKGFLFSKCKFVNSTEQEENLGWLLLHYGNIPEEHKQDKHKFVATYSHHMKRVIFERRSYIQTEYRKIFHKSMEKKLLYPFPTVEELTKCLTRDIETDREYEVFVFYCEELLGKMVGAIEWSTKIRCFTTISAALRQGYNDMPLISPADEAFAVLVVDNCLTRWTDEAQRNAENPNKDKNEKKKNVDGKYTTASAGQVMFGGWTSEGLEMFNKLQDMAIEARKTEKCKKVENMCLDIMRTKNKIRGSTWEEHKQRAKSKKRMRIDEGTTKYEEVPNKVVLANVEMVPISD